MPTNLPPGSPPRLALALIYARLPEDIAEAVSGDLEHEYRTRVVPNKGAFRANLWFWAQVVSLRSGALRRSSRRLRVVQPTWERNRPSRSHQDYSDLWSRLPMQFRDLKYAVRRLARSPGFTLVAVLSLALGIGANTAIFSLVNAVLIRELPVSNPEELVEVYSSESNGYAYATSSHPDYLDLRARHDVFKNVVATRTMMARVENQGAQQLAFGELVSWDYFQVLGVPTALGRSFLQEEDQVPGTHPVIILGHSTWVRDYAADPSIVGTSVRLNGLPFTVVGVAAEAFSGSLPVMVSSFYVPLMMTDQLGRSQQLPKRGSRNLFLKARLNENATLEQANQALKAFSLSLQEDFPNTNENRVMSALASADVALHPIVDRAATPVAALLLAVVGLVLLIACANLASFLLARGEDRRKEIAIRLALGAGRGRLIGQLLMETTLLAVMGGAAGALLAHWTVGLLMAFQPPLPIPVDFNISLDRTVLFFTAAISLTAGFLFGLVPALQATNPDVAPTLKNEGTGGGVPKRINLRSSLVVLQVAFSFVLLIGAGLFVRSLQKAQQIDPGFNTGAGALAWPMAELSGYDTPEEIATFYTEAGEALLAHPILTKVAIADRLPLGAAIQTNGFILPNVPSDTPDGDHDIDDATVSSSYFDVMGVDIVSGRAFDEADVDGERIIIVSQAFANRFYPNQTLIGQAIRRTNGTELRIIGIASDTKVRTLGETPRPYVYHLRGQRENSAGLGDGQFVVRGSATSEELVAATREVLASVAPGLVFLEAPKTMNDHLALLLYPPKMAALFLAVFGALALVLAAIGIYGVVSHAVAKRTRELGIRMALGASARDVVRMAVGGGMRLVLIGGIVGVVLAGAVTWSISGFLFGITSTDLATFVAIPLLLSGVAVFAAWIPARRASTVDPVKALRAE